MRTYDEMWASAREESAFSNGTEWECWSANWCDRCIHDKPARQGDEGNGCPLILIGFCGRTPLEWMEHERFSLGDRYHCIEFRDEDDGPTEPPGPSPQCPGQGELFDPAPYEGVRMFADIVPVRAALTPVDEQ
jgi:hypothetical protein